MNRRDSRFDHVQNHHVLEATKQKNSSRNKRIKEEKAVFTIFRERGKGKKFIV